MGVAFWLCVVVLFVFVAIYAQLARRVWRGEAPFDAAETPADFPGGPDAYRAFLRAYVAVGPCLIVFLGAGALDIAEPGASPGLLAISTVGLVLAVVAGVATARFGRPTALVPPDLRTAAPTRAR